MKKRNWKEIIDPCFDEMVKSFLSEIRAARNLPNEGLFQMPEEINKTVLSNDNLNSSFTINEEQILNQLNEIDKDLSNIILNLDEKIEKEIEEYLKSLLIIVNKLPEESRKFHTKEINSIYNNTAFIDIENLKGKEKEKTDDKNAKYFMSIILSIFSRYYFLTIDKQIEEYEKREKELFNEPQFCNFLVSSFYHFFSQIAFKDTLNELLTKGDDKSLLKAIRIDKTSIYSEAVKNRLMKAQLSGDNKFLNKLGNAIKANPLQKEDGNHETYIILRQFWPAGLYRLKHETLYYFLKDDCGLIPPDYPSNFEKFLQRHIKPLFD